MHNFLSHFPTMSLIFEKIFYFQMREIASKMERVDQEFQRRDVTIIRLDEKLKDGQNMVQSLAKALRDAEKNILAKNQQLVELQDQLDSQKQSLDAQELREFLHVENQVPI